MAFESRAAAGARVVPGNLVVGHEKVALQALLADAVGDGGVGPHLHEDPLQALRQPDLVEVDGATPGALGDEVVLPHGSPPGLGLEFEMDPKGRSSWWVDHPGYPVVGIAGNR